MPGRTKRLHDYLGDKITVLSFIFTRCNDVNGCPLATFVMKSVQEKVLGDPRLQNNVRVVSFSFDPSHDTPEVLSAYAGHFRDPGFDWQFLNTGTQLYIEPDGRRGGCAQFAIPPFKSAGNRGVSNDPTELESASWAEIER